LFSLLGRASVTDYSGSYHRFYKAMIESGLDYCQIPDPVQVDYCQSVTELCSIKGN